MNIFDKKIKDLVNDYENRLKEDEMIDDKLDHLVYEMKERHKISFIIPAYKSENYIQECLDSILKVEGLDEYEILLGIDNCLDTFNKVQEIKSSYKNLKIYWFPKNVGPYVVKNTLVKQSKFNTICFFDSDDIMLSDYLHNFTYFIKNTFVNVRCANFVHPDKSKIIMTYNPAGIIIVNKKDFIAVNGYADWRCGADSDLIRRLEMKGLKRIDAKKTTMLRRIHENNITNNELYGNDSIYRKERYQESLSRKKFKLKYYITSGYELLT